MSKVNVKIDAITARDEDYARWYTDVCRKAELMDYSSVKGFIIYRPYGYAIWEQIQAYLDRRFKETGHENVYMPLVIPESLFQKEKDHVEGFAPETLTATLGGDEKINDPLIIRPTSEVLFCEHFSKIVKSHRDLPILYNQWCSVVRWEKTTRPFLRGAEFLWQEGHTLHSSEIEARHETLQMLQIYNEMGRDLLAIPFVSGRKTEAEKFAGALETYGIEALMHDGKALQSGTTHYFGTGFAEAFDIAYQDEDNKLTHPHQTSWGVSTRLIGALIMVHGDDNGLVLPPEVAPIQVVIVPIQQTKAGVLAKAREVVSRLEAIGIRSKLDESDRSPGWKFSEWEMKGVPLRLEIGPRDLKNGVVLSAKRNDGVKAQIEDKNIEVEVAALLKQIQSEMYEKAANFVEEHTTTIYKYEDLDYALNEKTGYAKMMWCEDQVCIDKIKDEHAATARVMPFDEQPFADTCPVCEQKASKVVLVAKAY